ncbi:MAG: PHP domain-containing protein [Deferrisomatales bacterium]|nr:PHP domain-containing protein [Deferrisomatales bacterium]
MVDLHIHTTCSDGGLTPRQVVGYAVERRLTAVAITDHDSIEGNDEAVAAGREAGLPVVPGVEISTQWEGITFHLLGYGLRRLTDRVRGTFRFLVESRHQRNPRMIRRLQELGVDITLEEVLAEAGDSLVGRPHFARVLVRKGAVGSLQQAFDRYLGRGAPAYVHKERLTPAQSAELLREAGGLLVLAHPGLLDGERPGALAGVLEHLLPLGLAGIEAYYSRHNPEQVARYGELARRHGLLLTGGSDFHRPGEGGPEMGTGYGGLRVPDECYHALMERLASS